MRKLSIEEVQLLRQNNKGALFSVEELNDLIQGNASFEVFNKAEDILEKFRKRMQMPPSREEIAKNFVHNSKFQEFITKEFAPRINRQIDVLNVLIEKGIITMTELVAMEHKTIAQQWKHLCPECRWSTTHGEGGACSGFKLAGDVFKDLPSDLTRKVIECPDFEGKEIPVTAEIVK